MTQTYLKRGAAADPVQVADLTQSVAAMLAELEAGGEAVATRMARDLDRFEGEVVVSEAVIDAACARVPQSLKDDIAYAHENIARFATAQRDSLQPFTVELRPGLTAGQRLIPVQAAGCYVPGGAIATSHPP
jgi:sulfopropanediol 3-dehydrogenase